MPIYHQLESFNEVRLRLAHGGKRLKVLLDPRASTCFHGKEGFYFMLVCIVVWGTFFISTGRINAMVVHLTQ